MPSYTPQAAARGVQRLLLVIGLATFAGVLVAGLALPLVGSIGLGVRASAQTFQELPAEFVTSELAQRSVVYDEDGRVLATFADEFRIYRELRLIPEVMQQAIIATEDARFYEHGPIDVYGTSRALIRNWQESGSALEGQGGSTLTQQFVKLLLLNQAQTQSERRAAVARSPIRKLRELRLAMAAEERFTKDEILERYLNIAYFGGGAYGVEAAARHFFSTTAAKLTLPQAAMIAGLVQSPSRLDPTRNPEGALNRRNDVLNRMRDVKDISAADAARTKKLPLGLEVSDQRNGCTTSYAPFFCEFIRNEVRATPSLGATPEAREQLLRRGGLQITTSLDARVQAAAVKAARSQVDPTDGVASAIAMVEPGTGRIKALAQSSQYGTGGKRTYVNLAVDKDRGSSIGSAPGSTFKVFLLAAAIERGVPIDFRINSPREIDVGDYRFRTCDGNGAIAPGYSPRSSTTEGVKDMRSATAESQNTFFVQLQKITGLCHPARLAEKMGAGRADGADLQQVPSFTLGSNEVSPLGMAEAYATFAAGGIHCDSRGISEIGSLSGKQYEPLPRTCERVLRKNVADTVTQLLRGVMEGGTGAGVALPRVSAGKTGTTDDNASVWFAGYVPQLATAVGVWDPTSRRSLSGRRIGGYVRGSAGISGGQLPGPIWRQAMTEALQGVPVQGFDAPRQYRSTMPEQEELADGVPSVEGLTPEAASRQVRGAGYDANVVRIRSGVQRNRVIGTAPGPGSQLEVGTTVTIIVSLGSGGAGGGGGGGGGGGD